ncbi:hypothetical protein SNEBB_003810 [Seison nebaliae]|nr:hypothetical protein SNEBB_003810 [Seison nebaliae]
MDCCGCSSSSAVREGGTVYMNLAKYGLPIGRATGLLAINQLQYVADIAVEEKMDRRNLLRLQRTIYVPIDNDDGGDGWNDHPKDDMEGRELSFCPKKGQKQKHMI